MPARKKEYIFSPREDICEDMTELRGEIDSLDRTLVELLALRQGYMDQAARIKTQRKMVRDQDRVEDVLNKTRLHAQKAGANPDLIENLYRAMIEWCINYELTVFDQIEKTAKNGSVFP